MDTLSTGGPGPLIPTLIPVADDVDADAGEGREVLFCRFCQAGGHACFAEVWSPRQGALQRLFVVERAGLVQLRPAPEAGPRIGEPVCAGCGCTEGHACEGGCSWASVQLIAADLAPEGEPEEVAFLSVGICSTCDPLFGGEE